MSKINQEVNLVMLPTGKEARVGEITTNTTMKDSLFVMTQKVFTAWKFDGEKHLRGNNLYVTVSQDVELIKEGDWYLTTIYTSEGEIIKPLQWIVGHKPCGEQPMGNKIIATTDPKLINVPSHPPRGAYYIAQVQQSFLKEYVANPDGEFEVEYEEILTCKNCHDYSDDCMATNQCHIYGSDTLKLNQDNTVNITSVEEKSNDILKLKSEIKDLKTYIIDTAKYGLDNDSLQDRAEKYKKEGYE